MGTKNNPGQFDCYANAGKDEPMFVLLARDKHAPTLVWLWAALREFDGEDEAKVIEARTCVAEMMNWAADHGRKSVGIGQAALAGVMELVRTVNGAIAELEKNTPNAPTDVEFMRRLLCRTKFENEAEQPSA